jgi:hypothetical protein
MSIDYWIHHDLHLVWAEAQGILTAEDLFEYQRTVWSRPDVQGYDEFVDMTRVSDIPAPSPDGMHTLAALSASMDSPLSHSRFAIVAPDDLAYGLGRMYQTHRDLASNPGKEVAVFRTVQAGLDWLGLAAPPPRHSPHTPDGVSSSPRQAEAGSGPPDKRLTGSGNG